MNSDLLSLLIMLAAAAAIVGIAVGITLYGRRDAERRLESMRRRYTSETTGTVIDVVTPSRAREPSIITVRYEVDGHEYTLREHLKVKADGMRMGGFFVNIKKEYAMQFDGVGAEVRVKYLPADPAYAMLPDNEGVMEH